MATNIRFPKDPAKEAVTFRPILKIISFLRFVGNGQWGRARDRSVLL